MPIEECMLKHSERQLSLWLAWMDLQWNRPDRTDHYLMMVACEIRRVLSKNPAAIKSGDFELRFESRKSKPALTIEQATQYSQARWFALLDVDPKDIVDSKADDDDYPDADKPLIR